MTERTESRDQTCHVCGSNIQGQVGHRCSIRVNGHWRQVEPRMPRFHPRLTEGQLIRLRPGGPVWTVVGISAGSAQIKKGDWTTGEPGEVLDGLETGIESISLHAAVYPALLLLALLGALIVFV